MRKLLFFLFTLINLTATAKTYYVTPTGGSNNYPGTITQPWATWQKAFEIANAGDTVYFRGGVYYSLIRNDIDPSRGKGHSGTYANPIVYMSYPGEWAILDCSRHIETYGFGNGIYNGAIAINRAEHLYFKNFEVRNVFQLDHVISGGISSSNARNLTFEHIIMHNIGQRGFYIASGAWLSHYEDGDTQQYPPWGDYTDTTRFINCDVYNLCDSVSMTGNPPKLDPMNGADAWKGIFYRGNYVSFEGCRAWNYTDDGFDINTINGAIRVFDNCWVMASNKYLHSFEGATPERNGLKVAGADLGNVHVPDYTTIKNCLALFCVRGIYNLYWDALGDSNSKVYNNTAYGNGINFSGGRPTDVFRNNIGYKATTLSAINQPYECSGMSGGVIESNNTWMWSSGYPWFALSTEVTVSDADFVGLTSNWVTDSLNLVALFTAPRQADGSLPVQKPLMLKSTSDLIDAGINVGIPYSGSAPDIGYSEYLDGSVVLPPLPIYVNSVIETATPARLEMTYNMTLANATPGTTAFAVKVNNVNRAVNSVAISGSKVLLTLASPVIAGDVITVAYTKPASNPLQSAGAGQAASLEAQNVTNNVAIINPIFVNSVIENATPARLEMTYNMTLANVTPGTTAFAVKVNNVNRAVNSVAISGTKVLLTLASPVNAGDVITVAYTKPVSNPLQSTGAGQAASLSAQPVINNCSIIANQPPIITIVSPTKSIAFVEPATIVIEASANDPDGTISKVEFYNGSTKLGEISMAPYSFTWKEVVAGHYTLTSIATDNLGAKAISDIFELVVEKSVSVVNQIPVVNIISPSSGKTYKRKDKISFKAMASDPDGSISKVEFYKGSDLIEALTTEPYVLTLECADTGTYVITAIATDNLGAISTSSELEFIVTDLFRGDSDIIKLYPNPNSGHFSVDIHPSVISDRNTLTIFTLSGAQIFSETFIDSISTREVNLPGVLAGTYILTVSNGSTVLTAKKFIIK